jgi:tetratricopeptide (TPR) repeat protein
MLHQTWKRHYPTLAERSQGWLNEQVDDLINLRLLERVGGTPHVIDAHPLVRRGFEHYLGSEGMKQGATARAGFLRGRPDRRPPVTLADAREEIELFHAYCDAGLWNEADSVYIALDNPKHRFLAPAAERDLLLRFFAEGDWRRPPLWPGFGRFRSLAICFELLGQYEDALAAYPPADAPLRGDSLLALGQLEPLLSQPQAASPWQTLWQAYRAHALALANRTDEALALASTLVPVDIYEWVHVFECLLRARALSALDLQSMLYRPPHAVEHRWSVLARQRMRVDYLRVTGSVPLRELVAPYEETLEAYDVAGMPYERALTRLGYARLLEGLGRRDDAHAVNAAVLALAQRHGMTIMAVDARQAVAGGGRP